MHIEHLKKVYGEFVYAPYRTPYDPENEVQQLQLLLPTYKPAYHTSVPRKFLKIDTLLKKRMDRPVDEKQPSKTRTDSVNSERTQGDHKEMEGYGTDEDMETDDVDNHSEGMSLFFFTYSQDIIKGGMKCVSVFYLSHGFLAIL